MADIITKQITDVAMPEIPRCDELKALCRTEETLCVGDHFLKNRYNLIRVAKIYINDLGMKMVQYSCIDDLEKNEITYSYGGTELTEFIKQYGELYIPDPHKLYQDAVEFLEGNYIPAFCEESKDEDAEAEEYINSLVTRTSATSMVKVAQQKELVMRRVADLERMAAYHRTVLDNRLRMKMQELTKRFDALKEQITVIRKAIGMFSLYMGEEREILQIQSGETAPENTPFAIHQQVLFMDEECAVISDGGVDYNRIDEFLDWLVAEDHLSAILPEQKGIVALKPRRFDKTYSNNPGYDQLLNKWNKHTYFLIRNGANLYLIDSEHIEISERLFPLRKEMQDWYDKLSMAKNFYKKEHQKEIDRLNERYYRIILFLQGLLDQTDILAPLPSGINLFQQETYRTWIHLVYDDEPALTDGHESFQKWMEGNRSTVKRGSRILYVRPEKGMIGYSDQDLLYFAGTHFLHHYDNVWRIPALPVTGVYSVEKMEKNGDECLGFLYLPDDEVWSVTEGYSKRKQRISFLLGRDISYLNYDQIALEDIEYFLNNRVERKNYLFMFPILLSLRKELRLEQKQEDAFILMMKGELSRSGMEIHDAEQRISEAIRWWKTKNIWKRPISSDNAKALRMIRAKVLRSGYFHTHEPFT